MPRDASSWLIEANNYASGLVGTRQLAAAVVAYRRALACDPQAYEVWANLGSALWSLRRYNEAREACERSLALKPGYPMGLVNIGMVYEGTGDHESAMAAFDAGLTSEPDYALARWNRSVLRLARGEYAAAWPDYEARMLRDPSAYPKLSLPPWRGEDLADKSIHVEGEQGIGDTIMFARFLPLLAWRAAKVTFCPQPVLVPLLWGYREIVEFIPQRVPLPQADFSVYLGSLPGLLGIDSVDDVPSDPGYIRGRGIDAGRVIGLPAPESAPATKVGICWTGNPNMERNGERSVPFEELLTIAEDPRVWLYSLQAGPQADVLRESGAAGSLVCDLSDDLLEKSLVGCASAILQLDLVVTCCTSVAHLAGALGVPCWVMLCTDPYWPWLIGRDDSPWYPSARLFRQKVPGDWSSVIADVKVALAEVVDGHKGRALPVTYDPTVFAAASLPEAKAVILTPDAGLTDARWERETPYLADLLEPYAGDAVYVLDYGCGVGRLSKELLDRHPHLCVSGYDTSADMLRLSREYVRFPWFQTLEQKDLLGRQFDLIVSVWTLQHVFDLATELDRIAAILSPGGALFVINSLHRLVPTRERGFVHDGVDTRALLAERFGAVTHIDLDPGMIGADLAAQSFGAVYRAVERGA